MTKSVFTDKYEQFRLRLIDARKHVGLTQVQLAKELSRPQSFISKIERGERRLDVIEFLEIAKALGVDPYDFLRSVNDGKSPKRKSRHKNYSRRDSDLLR